MVPCCPVCQGRGQCCKKDGRLSGCDAMAAWSAVVDADDGPDSGGSGYWTHTTRLKCTARVDGGGWRQWDPVWSCRLSCLSGWSCPLSLDQTSLGSGCYPILFLSVPVPVPVPARPLPWPGCSEVEDLGTGSQGAGELKAFLVGRGSSQWLKKEKGNPVVEGPSTWSQSCLL